MTRDEAVETLAVAFSALSPTERSNLRYHALRGTEIACGEMANRYLVRSGG